MRRCVNESDELHKQCIKDQEEIQRIPGWARAISKVKANNSDLLQYSHSMTTMAEKGRKEVKEMEKQKAVNGVSMENTESAMKHLDENNGFSLQDVFHHLFHTSHSFIDNLTQIKAKVLYFAFHGYSALTKVHAASATTEIALYVAQLASNNIKQYLEESQEIQKSLQCTELGHAAQRVIVGQNVAIISDASFGFSLMQNTFFLTLLAAFVIADKPVW